MKKSRPPKEAALKKTHSNSTRTRPTLPMRCIRILEVLVTDHSQTREQVDRIAPASNGPHYVGIIRKRLHLNIHCEKVATTTKDGRHSWYGRYTTTAKERAVMRKYLQPRGPKL
ncbi:MAG: hypothetical protein ACJA1I_000461 [Zhongshania marina]|jgi:hypothetical protein